MVRLRFLEELKYWEIIEDMVITKKSRTKLKQETNKNSFAYHGAIN
jgi:hypothetical protein